jgi:glycosyltransferase involved in cell wall biosynthesis
LRVAILSVQIPFISGGAEILTNSLKAELVRRGHEAEIVSIPFKWYPPERILDHMLAARLIDVEEVNGQKIHKAIALKFPAYYAAHPNKTYWILHQHRQAYDLFQTEYGDLHRTELGKTVAAEIKRWDNAFLRDGRPIFTIAENVTKRLLRYNSITAETLYHPPMNHDRYYCEEYGDFVLYPGRFDLLKRQHVIVEAMRYAPRDLKLVLIGQHDSEYGIGVSRLVEKLELRAQVQILGKVSEEDKLRLFANCLAVYNGVYDEDYGYVTLEAFSASKPVITHSDSGGPLEFVANEENGYVTAPDPEQIGDLLRCMLENRAVARRMGQEGQQIFKKKNISWDYAIERLLT